MSEAAQDFCVVTGAFGYTGKYIARRLLAAGRRVKTLTGHPESGGEFGDRISVAPLVFDDPPKLVESLRGASVLFNTFWMRFAYGKVTYDQAVANSRTLIRAAEDAGVKRIVHVGVTNPSEDSPLPYFKGKAMVEKAIKASKLTYAILRPAVIFGPDDVLINNIAWLLRKFRVFPVPGSGDYKVQPVFVEDLAELAVTIAEREDNVVVNAVGPEVYTFNDLIRMLGQAIGVRVGVVHLNPTLGLFMASVAGRLVGDVIIQKWEIDGMEAGLFVCEGEATGRTRLSEWLSQNAPRVGRTYYSEMARHYR